MNILVVTPKLSKHGGVETYTCEVFSRLAAVHNIIMLVQEADVDLPGVKIIVKNKIKGPFWFSSLLNHFFNFFTIKKLKREYDIDVVFSNGGCLLFTDIVVAHSLHVAGLTKRMNFETKSKKTKFFQALAFIRPNNLVIMIFEYLIFKFTSKKIISVSAGVKRELSEFLHIPENKVAVIPNGVDLKKFQRNNSDREEKRKEMNIAEDEILIIFTGHEFKRKGLIYVIEAIAMARFKKFKLLVLGKDNPNDYLSYAREMKIEGKIIFLGQIKSGIEKYYSAADIFVFPTFYEAFSLATLEAAASGLPLLATKVNGTEDLIQENINGFFIDRSGQSIADRLEYLAYNKDEYGRICLNSSKIAQNFSWDVVAQNTLREILNFNS